MFRKLVNNNSILEVILILDVGSLFSAMNGFNVTQARMQSNRVELFFVSFKFRCSSSHGHQFLFFLFVTE